MIIRFCCNLKSKPQFPLLDVDECTEGIHLCNPITESCINELGGYKCELQFSLTGDSIPEVTTAASEDTQSGYPSITTPSDQIEQNNVSGPAAPQCPDGYIYNSLFRSCRGWKTLKFTNF